jgi:hypothetical protein
MADYNTFQNRDFLVALNNHSENYLQSSARKEFASPHP